MVQPASKFALLNRSPYAVRLRRGVAGLRFPAELEDAYQQARLQHVRERARIWQVVVFLLTLAGVFSRMQETGNALTVLETVARFGVLLPCSMVLVWAAWSGRYEHVYPHALRWALPAYYAAVTLLAAGFAAHGHVEALVVPAIHIIAGHFLAGLTFRQAAVASLLVVAVHFGAASAFGMPLANAVHQATVLIVVAFIAGIFRYRAEKASRLDFLEQSLTVELADRDPLTGLQSRRRLDEHLQRLWQAATRNRDWIALIVLDIDGFARLNDASGRDAGDDALRRIAQVVQEAVGHSGGMAARYGDDEVALVLHQRSPDYACLLGERLRRTIEHLSADPACPCTVSVGVTAVKPSLGRTLQGTLKAAESALAQARADGGNRVRYLQGEAEETYGPFAGDGLHCPA